MDNLEQINDNKDIKKEIFLEDLIKKNIEISEEILSLSKYIKKYVLWQKVMGWLKVFIILVPIILAFIYLPPFLKNLSNSLQSFLINPASIVDLTDNN